VFGRKDYQQFKLLCRMVRDLDAPVEILSCPTVRETDGLAMSSRNARLSPAQRADAPRIRKALLESSTLHTPAEILTAARSTIEASPLTRIDYLSLVDADERLADHFQGRIHLCVCGWGGVERGGLYGAAAECIMALTPTLPHLQRLVRD
jgi:pantoate--beta-alanine ligase